MRGEVKSRLKRAKPSEVPILDSEQLAIKILANATSYGIFVELNVQDLDPPELRKCHGTGGKPFPVLMSKGEQPGRYFHPLIATLITGAARLMLALSEKLAIDAGLDWALCDTDSMALAKPEGMDSDEFMRRARSVCGWFAGLNPYEKKGPLFKIEDTNYAIRDGKQTDEFEPLFCFAISAKRYVLFNRTADGEIRIRKASAHGLGHLLPPYGVDEAPKEIPAPVIELQTIGVERWHYDLWYRIIVAAIEGPPDQVDLGYHPALNGPAASRYAATTPEISGWFKTFNRNREYHNQVRPFNFMLAFQAILPALQAVDVVDTYVAFKKGPRKKRPLPKPVAPYRKCVSEAVANCFDREETEASVASQSLKTYRHALAQYHLSPESKFLNGEPYDRGPTLRRHVQVVSVRNIGKEANRWEEQYFLGLDEDEQIDYGMGSEDVEKLFAMLRAQIPSIGQREVARESGVSRRTVDGFVKGKNVRTGVASKLFQVVSVPNIGKEAKRREEPPLRGPDEDTEIDCGMGSEDVEKLFAMLRARIPSIGQREEQERVGSHGKPVTLRKK
jgi:hypothetical protein